MVQLEPTKLDKLLALCHRVRAAKQRTVQVPLAFQPLSFLASLFSSTVPVPASCMPAMASLTADEGARFRDIVAEPQ